MSPVHRLPPLRRRPSRLEAFRVAAGAHILAPGRADVALCGAAQPGRAWSAGLPACEACLAVAQGRMS